MVATIFPLYDFARATAKEQANVTMLMPPENLMHSFEPSPTDRQYKFSPALVGGVPVQQRFTKEFRFVP
jgi:hypothetical protein